VEYIEAQEGARAPAREEPSVSGQRHPLPGHPLSGAASRRRRRSEDGESSDTEVEEPSPAKRPRLATKGKSKATPSPTPCAKTLKQKESAKKTHEQRRLSRMPCEGCARVYRSWKKNGGAWGSPAEANKYFPCCVGEGTVMAGDKKSCTRCQHVKSRCCPQRQGDPANYVTQRQLVELVTPEERQGWLERVDAM